MSTLDLPSGHQFQGSGTRTAEAPPLVAPPKKPEVAKPPRGPRRKGPLIALGAAAAGLLGGAIALLPSGGKTQLEAGSRPTTTSVEGSSSTAPNIDTTPNPLGNSAEALQLQAEIDAASNEYGFPMRPVSTKHTDPRLIYQSVMHNFDCYSNKGSDECRIAVFGDPIHANNELHTSVVGRVESNELGPNGVFLWHSRIDPDPQDVGYRETADGYAFIDIDAVYDTAPRGEEEWQLTPNMSNEHHTIEVQIQDDGSHILTGFVAVANSN